MHNKKTKNNFLSTLAIAAGAVGFAVPSSFAELGSGLSLGVTGVASIQNPTFNEDGSNVVSGKTGYGGGITSEFVVAEGFGLEIDALYLSHKFEHSSTSFFGSSVSSTYSSGYLQIPALIRYRPISALNLGAGVYYSRVLTGWTVAAEGFSDVSANYGKDDFGFALALGSKIAVSEDFSLVGDLRYTRSLNDSARNSSDALKFSDFQVLVGLTFGAR